MAAGHVSEYALSEAKGFDRGKLIYAVYFYDFTRTVASFRSFFRT